MKINILKNRAIFSTLFAIIITISLIIFNGLFFAENYNHLFSYILCFLFAYLACFLFAVKIDFPENKHNLINASLLAISVVMLCFSIELLNKNNLFSIDINRMILNYLIIFILYTIFWVFTNRARLSVLITGFILFLLIFSSYIVTSFRGTPLSLMDILCIGTALSVASTYTFSFDFYLIFGIISFILFIAITLKISLKFNICKKNILIRCLSLSLVAIFTILFYSTNLISIFGLDTYLWIPANEYANNGFLASFLKQSRELIIKKPDNYSISQIESIYYQVLETVPTVSSVIHENQNTSEDKPHIIVIMNESFADLSVHRNIDTNEEYLPFFNSILNNPNTISGKVHTSVFGGKTPNSEWEFLTNNSMAFFSYGTIPYQQFLTTKSYSFVSLLKSQGYTTYAFHPWNKSGYRRSTVYSLLGFDNTCFLEDCNDLEYVRDYPSDLSTYKKIIELFENKADDELFFNFTITMQNHSGYDYSGVFNNTISLTDVTNCPRTEQYLSLLKLSDEALEYLINYFSNVNENVVILFFGDHQPPYLEDEFWDYLNEFSTNSLLDVEKTYLTPYFIWTNYEVNNIKKYEKDDISLNYLSILLSDVAGLQISPYMNFLKNIQKDLPVITGHGYMDSDGNCHNLDEQNEFTKYLNNYEILQYNNMFDKKNIYTKIFEID